MFPIKRKGTVEAKPRILPAERSRQMRRIAGMCVLLVGCCGTVGPRERVRVCLPRFDNPCLTIKEQERTARSELALPEPSMNAGPRTFAEYPGYYGRLAQ
jgi:hypothetical protein